MPEKKAARKPEAPAAPAAPEAPAAAEAGARKKKINELSLAELDARLAECGEKQGNLISKYARQLLARKKALTS